MTDINPSATATNATPATSAKQDGRRGKRVAILNDADGLYYDQRGRRVCGAKLDELDASGVNLRCPSFIMANGRCRKHGGKTPKGSKASNYKSGKYSNALPPRMATRYERALADPDLLSLRHEIASLEARIVEVMDGLSTGETGQAWHELDETVNDLRGAMDAGNVEAATLALNSIAALVSNGCRDSEAWEEITNLYQHKRKLADSEHRTLDKLDQFISIEQSMLMVGLLVDLVDSVLREVLDDKTAAIISKQLSIRIVRFVINRNGGAVQSRHLRGPSGAIHAIGNSEAARAIIDATT